MVFFTTLSHSQTVKTNILMAALYGDKETRFHSGTWHISKLTVSTSKYHVCPMSYNKISLICIVIWGAINGVILNRRIGRRATSSSGSMDLKRLT